MLKMDGDLRSLRKLLSATNEHADRLKKELTKLHPALDIEAEKEAMKLRRALEKIEELCRDTSSTNTSASAFARNNTVLIRAAAFPNG